MIQEQSIQLEQPLLANKNPKLKTNRLKAIIFMNLFAILMPLYQLLVKIATNEKGVSPLDVIVARTFACLTGSIIVAKSSGHSFFVKSELRRDLFMRSMQGTIGHLSFTFGIMYVPLVIVNILYNTAPFWTFLLAWCMVGERLTGLQIAALVMSFIGICLISRNSSKSSEANESTSAIND